MNSLFSRSNFIAKFALTLIFVAAYCAPVFAQEPSANSGQIYLKLGDAKTKKSNLALTPLLYLGNATSAANYQTVGSELFNVISNDLTVSTLFVMMPQKSFIEDVTKTGLKPVPENKGFHFDTWKSIGADFLLRAGFSVAGNEVSFEAYLYNVAKGSLLFGRTYKGNLSAIRKLAHTFSNDIVKELTGSQGMFLSKIVAGSDRGGNKFKEIYLMDWDGVNVEQITSHKTISLSPSISKDGSKILYTAFVERAKTKLRNADLLMFDRDSGKRKIVSYREGFNSGGIFSSSGESIYMTISNGGSPDIFEVNLDGKVLKQITKGPSGAINVEPAISPDGKKIAFSSDRAGRPMIYTMDLDGSNLKRLTIVGAFNSSPAWSPDGKYIAFAGQMDSHFDIYVMDSDGKNMRRLTSAKKPNGRPADHEDPSFSPDGRFIMYTSNKTGKSQIYFSTLDGSEERKVTSDNANYFKPRWSENL